MNHTNSTTIPRKITANSFVVPLRPAIIIPRRDLMSFPRGSIAGLMILVMFAATNCAAVNGLLERPFAWKAIDRYPAQ